MRHRAVREGPLASVTLEQRLNSNGDPAMKAAVDRAEGGKQEVPGARWGHSRHVHAGSQCPKISATLPGVDIAIHCSIHFSP